MHPNGVHSANGDVEIVVVSEHHLPVILSEMEVVVGHLSLSGAVWPVEDNRCHSYD